MGSLSIIYRDEVFSGILSFYGSLNEMPCDTAQKQSRNTLLEDAID